MNAQQFMNNGMAFFDAAFSKGEIITGDDVRMLLNSVGVQPPKPCLWGVLMRTLKARGLITATGEYRKSVLANNNAHAYAVYQVG